jgi:hypothetical protein
MTIHIAQRSAIAMTASSSKTLVTVTAGSTKRLRLKEIGISFNDTNAALVPVLVELLRGTADGTGTGLTLAQNDLASEAPIATAKHTHTVEPTYTANQVLASWYVTPAGGLFVMQYPLGDEIIIPTTGVVGIRYTTGASTTSNAAAYIKFDE